MLAIRICRREAVKCFLSVRCVWTGKNSTYRVQDRAWLQASTGGLATNSPGAEGAAVLAYLSCHADDMVSVPQGEKLAQGHSASQRPPWPRSDILSLPSNFSTLSDRGKGVGSAVCGTENLSLDTLLGKHTQYLV